MHSMFYCSLLEVLRINLKGKAVKIVVKEIPRRWAWAYHFSLIQDLLVTGSSFRKTLVVIPKPDLTAEINCLCQGKSLLLETAGQLFTQSWHSPVCTLLHEGSFLLLPVSPSQVLEMTVNCMNKLNAYIEPSHCQKYDISSVSRPSFIFRRVNIWMKAYLKIILGKTHLSSLISLPIYWNLIQRK